MSAPRFIVIPDPPRWQVFDVKRDRAVKRNVSHIVARAAAAALNAGKRNDRR